MTVLRTTTESNSLNTQPAFSSTTEQSRNHFTVIRYLQAESWDSGEQATTSKQQPSCQRADGGSLDVKTSWDGTAFAEVFRKGDDATRLLLSFQNGAHINFAP
jgi:hypothetical protein